MNAGSFPFTLPLAVLKRGMPLLALLSLVWSCEKLSQFSFQSAAEIDAGFAGVESVTLDDKGRFVLAWTDPPRTVNAAKLHYEVYFAVLDEEGPALSRAPFTPVMGPQGPVARTRSTVVQAQQDVAPATKGEPIGTVRGATTYTVAEALEDGRVYGFRVRLSVSDGIQDANQRVLILKKDAPDYPGCIRSQALDSTSAEVTFDFPSGASQVQLMRGQALVFTSLGQANASFTDVGLTPATSYTYKCVATIGGKNILGTNDTTVTTLSRMGFAGLKSSGVVLSPDYQRLTLSWPAATTPRGEVTYTVFGDANFSEVLAQTTTQTYTLSGLTPGKLYSLGVRARDDDGFDRNTEIVVVPVPDTRDRTPPAFDGLEEATPASNTKIALRWQPSTSSDIHTYRVYSVTNLNQPIAATAANSYLVSGLVPSTAYTFIVRAVDTSGNEDRNTVQRSATTLSYAVPDFTGLTHVTPLPSTAGLTQLRLTWPVAGGSVTGYKVYMSSSWGGQNFAAPVATLGATTSNASVGPYVAGQGTTSAVVTGLSSGTSSYFVIRAFYLDGNGTVFEETNTVERQGTTITAKAPTFAGVSSAVAGAGILGFSTASVSWGDPGLDGIYDQFAIEYEPGSCTGAFSATPASLSVLDPTTRTAVVTGLTRETTYRFRVRAKYPTLGLSDVNTACREARTEPLPPTFSGVSSVSTPAGIPGFSSLTVAWPEVQGSFSHYLVEWSTSSTFATVGGSLAPITQAATTSATLTGLPSNTMVYVRVKAVFDGGGVTLTSGGSKILSGLTSPQAPLGEGLQSIATVSGTSLRLTWTPPTNAAAVYSGYKVWRACGSGAAGQVLTSMSGVATQTVSNTTLTWLDTGLTSNVECCYQVRAFYDDGTYTLTSASTTLPQCGMPRVIAPAFAGVSTAVVPIAASGFGQIDLTWQPIAQAESNNFSCYQVSVATTPTGLAWPADCTSVDASLRSPATAGYSVSGLNPNTTYFVRARVVNMSGSAPVSNGDNAVLSATTTPKLPTGDSLGTVEPAGVTSITLNYIPPSVLPQVSGLYNNIFLYLYQGSSTGAQAYKQSRVDPATVGSATFSATMSAGLAPLSSPPTAGALVRIPLAEVTPGHSNVYRIAGLTSGQPVCVMATAVHWVSGAPGQFLESTSGVWRCTTPTAEAPVFAGVSSVVTPVSASGFSQLHIAWTPVGAGELGKFSSYSVDWATSPTPATWNEQQITDAAVGSYVIAGLTPNTTYFVRVRAVNARGSSPVSNGATTVLQGSTTPKGPTGDQLSSLATPGQTSVSLTYTSPSSDPAVGGLYNNIFLWVRQGTPQDLQAYQSTVGTPALANITGVLSGSTVTVSTAPTQGMLFQIPPSVLSGGNSQTFTIAGLTPNQPVCVRALAVHWITGQSSQYLTSPSTAIQCGTPVAVAPTFAGVSSVTGFDDARDFASMTVSWGAVSGSCTSLDVSVSPYPGTPDFSTSSYPSIKDLACSTTSTLVGGLTPGQTYYVQVRAKNATCGTAATCSSGQGVELSRRTLIPTPTGDGINTLRFATTAKAIDAASLTYTLATLGLWNRVFIWRGTGANQTEATAAVRAAAVTRSDYSGPVAAPLAQVTDLTQTTYTDNDPSLIDGRVYCYLVKGVWTNGTYYNASTNQSVQCGSSTYTPIVFSGVGTTGGAELMASPWADGTAKIRLNFSSLPAGSIEEYWVYYSSSSALANFDFDSEPWQIIDNMAVNAWNPTPGSQSILIGGNGRVFSGDGYFVVRFKHYQGPTNDSNTSISNVVAIPTSQANYVRVSREMSKLSYDYYIGAHEASLASGSFTTGDAVTSDEVSLTSCSYQFHTSGVAMDTTCGTKASTARVASVASATPVQATWHQAFVGCRNASVNGLMVRLPSETEWRRASRWNPSSYGTQWSTYSGGGATECNTGVGSLTATGSRSSCVSMIGAYDMAGNSREWVDQRLTAYDINAAAEARFSYGPTIGRIIANGMHVQASAPNVPVTRRYHEITPGSNNLALLLGSDYVPSVSSPHKQYDAETETWQDPTVSTTTDVPARGFRCVAWPNKKVLPTMAQLALPSEPVHTASHLPSGLPSQWSIPENLYVNDTRAETVTHITTANISGDSVTIAWSPWSKQVCNPSCSPAADSAQTYHIYRFIEPTLIDIRTAVPWALKAGPYAALPATVTGAQATAMLMDPLAVTSAGQAICTGSTTPCKLVAPISGASCRVGATAGCTFTDSGTAGTGFDPTLIYNYIMVVQDAEGNYQIPRVQRFRSPYFIGAPSLQAASAFRTEYRWRRAANFLVNETYQTSGQLQANPQIMVYVPMHQSGLDHDFFMHKYEASIVNTGAAISTTTGQSDWPIQGLNGGWSRNAGACEEQRLRTGTLNAAVCGDGTNNNSTAAVLQSKVGTAPQVTINQGAFWKACANTGIKDGLGNTYFASLPTDAEWLKAADWGDVDQNGVIDQSVYTANIGLSAAALENGTGDTTTVRCHTDNNPSSAYTSNDAATANCRSRFGAADMVGNVWEWTTGQIFTGVGSDNGVDGLWLGQTFPTATNSLSGIGSRYDLLRGIPKSAGAPAVAPNSDYYWYSSALRGAIRGGSWYDGSYAGRWALNVDNAPSNRLGNVGGRCRR